MQYSQRAGSVVPGRQRERRDVSGAAAGAEGQLAARETEEEQRQAQVFVACSPDGRGSGGRAVVSRHRAFWRRTGTARGTRVR